MARPGVEYEAVERVARQLMSQGLHPSVQKVREVLGTGSNTTIAKHLKMWHTSFVASRSPALPEAVPEDLMNPLDDFWSLALAKAEGNYQHYKTELDARVNAAETAQAEVEAQLEAKSAELAVLQQTLSQTQGALQNTEQQWHTLQGKYAQASKELAEDHNEVARLLSLLQEQEHAFAAEREKLNDAHQEAITYERERATASENQLLNEVDRLRQSVKALQADVQRQQKDMQNHQEDSHQRELTLLQEQAKLQSENKQLDADGQKYRHECVETKQHLATLQGQLTTSLETIEAHRQTLEEAKNREIKLTEKVGQLNETIAHLQQTQGDSDNE